MGVFDGVELDDLVLHGPRLTLRPYAAGDAEFVFTAMQDPDVARFLGHVPQPYTRADAHDFVTEGAHSARAAGTGLASAVVLTETGEPVGDGFLRLPDGGPGEVGYWVAPAAQGNGYAAEVVDVLARWAFAHRVTRIELLCDPLNVASAATALTAGFRFEGYRRGAYDLRGVLRDDASFARLASDDGKPVPWSFPRLREPLTDGVIALRPTTVQDAEAFVAMHTDPVSLAVGLGFPPLTTAGFVAKAERYPLDWLVGQHAQLSIVDVGTGQVAGELQFRLSGPPGTLNLGYTVHPDFRGRSYTTRALRLASAWAFGTAGFARLELGAKSHNVASQKVAEAAGFTREGLLTGRLREPDGTYADEFYYGLVSSRVMSP